MIRQLLQEMLICFALIVKELKASLCEEMVNVASGRGGILG